MLECLIIGDSIAQGMQLVRPDCAYYAKAGITTIGWLKRYESQMVDAKSVLISLGTNDWEGANSYEHLKRVRALIKSGNVFWIVPNAESRPKAALLVKSIAKQHSDTVIESSRWQADKIHPSWAGYKQISMQFK